MSDQASGEPSLQEQIAAFQDRIAPFQGGRATLSYYVTEAREAQITVQNDEQTCTIFCKWCRSLQMNGPLQWENCHFTIRPQPYTEHHTDVVIADEHAGFAVYCDKVRVILPGETGFQSKEMTALVVLDQMPFVIHDLRHHLHGITTALKILRMDPSQLNQPLTPEDREYFLTMAWERSLRLRDEIDRLLDSTVYRRDEDSQSRQEASQEPPSACEVAGHVTSIIGHDLHNPLNSVYNYLHLLLQRGDQFSKEDRDDFITIALRAIERTRTVTTDISTYCQTVINAHTNESYTDER